MSNQKQDDQQKEGEKKLETREAGKNVPVEEGGLIEEHKDSGEVMEVEKEKDQE